LLLPPHPNLRTPIFISPRVWLPPAVFCFDPPGVVSATPWRMGRQACVSVCLCVCVAVSSFSVSPGIRITCKETRAVALFSSSSPSDIRRVHSKMSVCPSPGTVKRWCISTPIYVCMHICECTHECVCARACVCVHAYAHTPACTYSSSMVVNISATCKFCQEPHRKSHHLPSPRWLDLLTDNALKISRAMCPCSAPRGYAQP